MEHRTFLCLSEMRHPNTIHKLQSLIKWNFSLKCLFAFTLICGILCAAVFYLRRSQNDRHSDAAKLGIGLVYIGFAAHDVAIGTLPAVESVDSNGIPMASWRLYVLKFAMPSEVIDFGYSDLMTNWKSPTLSHLVQKRPPCYCFGDGIYSGTTNVMVATGPGTPFDSAGLRLADLDSDTIVLIEVYGSRKHWMEPGDLHIERLEEIHNLFKESSAGLHVAFADGLIWRLNRKTPIEKLVQFLTVDGAKTHDRDLELREFCTDTFDLRDGELAATGMN